MTRYLRVWGDHERNWRANGNRTKRPLVCEQLESRTVLDAGLTAGTATPVIATAGTLVTGTPLVSFTDGTSPLPANQYAATIDWGDGTPISAGTISVSGATFTVAGSHNFGEPSQAQPGGVYTVTVDIIGDGQQTSATTSATVGGLKFGFVPDPFLPIELAPMVAVAGTPTGGLGIAPFWASPTPDPAAYSAVIDWGDGSATTTATIVGADNGALVASTSGHDYGSAGDYTITTTVRDAQGFAVGTGSEPIYVRNPVAASTDLLSGKAGSPTGPLNLATISADPFPIVSPALSGAPATIKATSADLSIDPFDSSYYSAVIDWGDGSPPGDATFTYLNNFEMNVSTSGHTYARAGMYTMTLTIRDAQGVVVDMVNPMIAIVDALSGRLSPQSDTGVSHDDGITKITMPTFIGEASPGATVEVFAAAAGSSSPPGHLIATGTANGSGTWSATDVRQPMADGTYAITGAVVTSSGSVLATASLGTLVVDTVGPVVKSVKFDRQTATAVITFQDDQGQLDLGSISTVAFYHVSTRPVAKGAAAAGLPLATAISVTRAAPATSPDVVTVVFPDAGKALRPGRYLLEIDSGDSGNGVEDVAGNALVGDFSGRLPSGDGRRGGNVVALIAGVHGDRPRRAGPD